MRGRSSLEHPDHRFARKVRYRSLGPRFAFAPTALIPVPKTPLTARRTFLLLVLPLTPLVASNVLDSYLEAP